MYEKDENTGLPVLPEGSFWRVSKYGNWGYDYKIAVHRKIFFGLFSVQDKDEWNLFHGGDDLYSEAVEALYFGRDRREERRLKAERDRKLTGNYPPKKA